MLTVFLPMVDALIIGMGSWSLVWGVLDFVQSDKYGGLYQMTFGALLIGAGLYGRIRRKKIRELG